MATSTASPEGAELEALRHWSTFGQRGRRPDHRVTPWEWKNKPFSQASSAEWGLRLESTHLTYLMMGFVPKSESTPIEYMVVGDIITTHGFMSTSQNPDVIATEDKWFIYASGPMRNGEVRVHMYRSWTGNKQLELVIDAGMDGLGSDGKGPTIKFIIWESDPQYSWKDAGLESAKETAREVCSWVLNVDLPLDNRPSDDNTALTHGENPLEPANSDQHVIQGHNAAPKAFAEPRDHGAREQRPQNTPAEASQQSELVPTLSKLSIAEDNMQSSASRSE